MRRAVINTKGGLHKALCKTVVENMKKIKIYLIYDGVLFMRKYEDSLDFVITYTLL